MPDVWLQNCLEMERFLEREPATSLVDDARCPSPAAAAAVWQTRSLVLRPEAVRIRSHSSCAEDDEALSDATANTNRTRLNTVSAAFDSDSGCGTSEPSSPDAALTVTASSMKLSPPVCRSLSADAGAEVVVVMTCRCVEPEAAKSRRRRSFSSESSSLADRLSDDVDGASATDSSSSLVGSRTYRCSFQGCRKMYTKRSHLKSHLRSHTGQVHCIITAANLESALTCSLHVA